MSEPHVIYRYTGKAGVRGEAPELTLAEVGGEIVLAITGTATMFAPAPRAALTLPKKAQWELRSKLFQSLLASN